jgi:hypothetical protein
VLFPFLLHPVPELLERHARQRTAHFAQIWKIIGVLGGKTPAASAVGPEPLPEPLSKAEARVLRFLQTSALPSSLRGARSSHPAPGVFMRPQPVLAHYS